MVWMPDNGVCMTVIYHNKFVKVNWRIVFPGFLWICILKLWSLRTSKHTKCLRQESWFENQGAWSHIKQFLTLIALCSKLNDEFMCLTASLNLNVKYCPQYVQEGRWKVKIEATGSTRYHITLLNKNLLHWRTHTLGFCRKPNPSSIQWLGHPNSNPILLHYRSIPCLNTLLRNVGYLITLLKYSLFITLLSYTQHFYIAERYAILSHRWGIAFFLLCWTIANFNTLSSYT